ncbi:MAG TPA: transglutaminaseTgpA domain-containing protein, partial [Dehalococcoidia bacterium]
MSMESHWRDVFGAPSERPAAREPWRLPGWLTDWEQWLTLGVMLLVTLSAAFSVQAAGWVAGMPSLAVPSLAGLLTAMFLARVRRNELLLHPLGLTAGLAVVLLQVLRFVGEGGLRDRLDQVWDRLITWVDVVRDGGISTDNLPFVAIVLALAWLAAYLGGWAAFRWRNGWLAAVPSGVALLVNLSYQPGGFSPAFVVFALGALLLLTRTHAADAMRRWRQQGVEYPQSLSLLALNGTIWVGAALLLLVLVLPTAGPMTGLTALWEKVRTPVESWTVDWGLFTTVNAKKPVPIHRFGDTMPLQGSINLSGREVARVRAGSAPYPVFLRAAVYDVYAGTGWKAGPREQVPFQQAAAQLQGADYQRRHAVTATVDPARSGEVLLGPGQPLNVDGNVQAEVVPGSPFADVVRLLRGGGRSYDVTGTISAATADELRRAGTNYPAWVREQYLQLPDELPDRVRALAREWAGQRTNPYDVAKAIEDQLRTYP